MYNASEQFHSAVIADSPEERALLLFDDLFFSNEDIEINTGIKVTENFNLAEELTIGQTPCSQLTTKIINYAGLLSGYNFGEFRALLGVKTATEAYVSSECEAFAWIDATMYVQGFSATPYLLANGAAVAQQPASAVYALCVDNDNLYTIHADGSATKYVRSGQTWAKDDSFAANDFMQDKWARWAEDKRSLSMQGNIVRELAFIPDALTLTWGDFSANTWADMAEYTWGDFSNVAADVWEYAPLGTFVSEKPEKVKVDLISLTAKDYMMEFDVEGDVFWSGLTYPITLGEIYSALCTYVGVTPASTTFINSTRSFASAPASLEGVTCREILGWIAEAACSIARFNRDGQLELAWFAANDIEIPWHFTQNVAEYSVPVIDKLQVKSAENDIGVIIGTGTNAYVILDNPFLYGSSDAEIRGYATPIYDRLSAFAGFAPSNTVVTCDWSVEAEDIVIVNGVAIPIYVQTITWNGACKAIYESTGAEKRPVVNAVNRRVYSQNKAMHELVTDVNGISSRLTSAEGEVASLEFTTAGLNLALANNKLAFDASGLHIYNGAFEIFNSTNTKVFGVDTSGNISATGTFSSQSGSWKAELSTGGLDFYYNSTRHGGIRSHEDGLRLMVDSVRITNDGQLGGYIGSTGFGPDGDYDTLHLINYSNGQHASLNPKIFQFYPTTGSGTTAVFTQWSDGSYGLVRSTSSRRYKKDIADLDVNLYAIIDKMNPVTYKDLNGDDRTYLGFIAEDMINICPELVITANIDGKILPDAISYDRIPVLLVKDAQETHRRLDAIERILNNKECENIG